MSDEFDDWYRRTSGSDAERPGEEQRQAILAFARAAAAQAAPAPAAIGRARPAVRARRWRVLAGSLAAACVAGLVVVPIWHSPPQRPSVPMLQPAAPPHATAIAPGPTAAPAPTEQGAPARYSGNLDSPKVADAERAESAAATDSLQERHALAKLSSSAPARAAAPPEAAVDLRQAATRGDLSRLQVLLERRVDLEARDVSGRTALMLAVINGRADAVELLLAHGANPNAEDAEGLRPGEIASRAGNSRIVDDLLRATSSGTR